MKIIVNLFSLVVLLFTFKTAYGQIEMQGDLSFRNSSNTTITVTIECFSIPFEGLNQQINTGSYNRIDTLQNGSIYRRFMDGIGYDFNIYYHKFDIEGGVPDINIPHCSYNLQGLSADHPVWGYGKYKISIFDGLNHYYAFLNNLDSRFSSPVNNNNYSNDFLFEYTGIDQDVIFRGTGSYVYTASVPVYSQNITIPEFKVWEIIQFSNEPLERRFYVRTTPFGLRPSDLNLYGRREYIIGTTVILDTVWKEDGNQDRWGFNTQNDPYYINPTWVPNNDPGNTFISPGHYYYVNNEFVAGLKFTMEYSDTLILKNDKKLFIKGNVFSTQGDGGDTLLLKQGSCVILENNAELNTYYGGTLTSEGGEIVMNSNAIVEAYEGIHAPTEINIFGEIPTIVKGGKVKIQDLATLRIGDNATLIFEGAGAHLDIHPDANLILGENSNIEFRNGAYLDAENITFEGNNGATWDGLVFHNAGGETQIKNCIFKDAKISIDIKNTTGCYADLEKRIIDNTFIQSGASTHSIQAENIFKLLLRGNTFNLVSGKTGVEINNTINAGPPMAPGGGGESSCINTSYALNILENTFNNGKYQLYLNCYASQVTPFWVFNNIFNSSSTTNFSLIGRKITGDIKMNNFVAQSQVMHNVLLMQSSVNMLDNTMNSQVRNIVAGSQSIWKMAPIYQNNQWIWLGGYNRLSSQQDNIEVTGSNHNLPLIDKGRNCFTIPTNQGDNKFHIIGHNVPWNVAQHQVYYMRENAWSGWMGNNPVINIRNQDGQYINYYYQPVISCPSTAWSTYTLDDKGFGIYDTVYYVSGLTGSPDPEPDEGLYYQAIYAEMESDFLTSINTYKVLIEGYPESPFTESCLYDLYSCYTSLDTSSDGTYTDYLYSDLTNFLTQIIIADTHSEEFNYIAYEVLQMCEASMGKYYDALTGYEFISMYHPDPETRFLASADYAEIMDLLGEGQGGMELSAEEKLSRLESKLTKLIKGDPVAQKLSRQFETNLEERIISTHSREVGSHDVKNMSRQEKEEKAYSRLQKEMISKSNTLLFNARGMTKEERREFVREGIYLMAGLTPGGEDISETITPSSYSLSQNYPNPFNPETNISFTIPVEGLVKLKVFDITGREVAVLVNELKTPGSYNVSFNGSTLSSGVYFYRIEAGSFVETKRMLLIK